MRYRAPYPDPVTGSRRPLLAVGIRPVWEQSLQELVGAGADHVQQILDEHVFILVCHTRDVVHDVSSIVLDQKLCTTTLKVGVG